MYDLMSFLYFFSAFSSINISHFFLPDKFTLIVQGPTQLLLPMKLSLFQGRTWYLSVIPSSIGGPSLLALITLYHNLSF